MTANVIMHTRFEVLREVLPYFTLIRPSETSLATKEYVVPQAKRQKRTTFLLRMPYVMALYYIWWDFFRKYSRMAGWRQGCTSDVLLQWIYSAHFSMILSLDTAPDVSWTADCTFVWELHVNLSDSRVRIPSFWHCASYASFLRNITRCPCVCCDSSHNWFLLVCCELPTDWK
jgi:hypothetical protein